MKNQIIACSFFTSAQDNQPRPWEGSWDDLREILGKDHKPRRGTSGDEAKKSMPAICGASFRAGTTRAAGNVDSIQVLFFDVDNATEEPTGEYWPDPRTGKPSNRPKMRKVPIPEQVTLEDVQEALWNAGVQSYIWTTWSHRPEGDPLPWTKFRVAIPLGGPVPPELWSAATEWAITQLGLEPFRRGIDLPVLRDVARLNFLPGAPNPENIRREETAGEFMEIPLDRLPQAAPPLPVPQWQAEIIRQRATEGNHWARRFVDSQARGVDLRTLDAVRLLEALGCRVGPARPHGMGVKHRTTCPWYCEHTGGRNDDSGCLFLDPGKWPTWTCSHSSHLHLGLRDLLEAAGVLR